MLTGGASSYAALQSRVRVMYGALLTPTDEARLSESADLATLIGLLKNTAYGPYLADLDDKGLNPKLVTGRIKKRISDLYQTIIRSTPTHTRPLLIQFFRHFEVDNLKAILRAIVIGASWEQVEAMLFPLGSFATLPAQTMLETGKIETAVTYLSSTPYYTTITSAMKRYTDEHSLFPLEVALDLDYWRTVWNATKQLSGQDREWAVRCIGPLLDMNNLMWSLRYRIYHHLSEEEVINYTLPIGYRLQDEDIRAIAAGADIASIVARRYPQLPDVDEMFEKIDNMLPKLEISIQRHNRQHLTAAFTGYPFHIGLPLAFLMLLELELQDLTVLVEAKSARMKPEEIAHSLILRSDAGARMLV